MRVLVLGGYGNFGARICRALAGDAAIELLIGGRDRSKAEALAAECGGHGLRIDMAAPDFAARMREQGVGLLIHTAGPFQRQADYAVARAAAVAGAHYIDLADGRRFVCDFAAALDDEFRAAGRTAISGASTVPALSSAVIDALSQGWQALEDIDICIAPAQTAPRGEATLAAVLSYCGEAIPVWQGGTWVNLYGWSDLTPVSFKRMRPRLAALCDIPDLELLAQRYAGVQGVMFRAALEVGVSQRSMALLAWLRRWRLLPQPARFAGAMFRGARLFDSFGSALGGMVVRLRGRDAAGHAVVRAWHIAADHDHGPEIPCMATILLARKLAQGEPVPVGAQACMGLLRLDEFEPEFQRWGMQTDVEIPGGMHGASPL